MNLFEWAKGRTLHLDDGRVKLSLASTSGGEDNVMIAKTSTNDVVSEVAVAIEGHFA
jgi:hypothetical protein